MVSLREADSKVMVILRHVVVLNLISRKNRRMTGLSSRNGFVEKENSRKGKSAEIKERDRHAEISNGSSRSEMMLVEAVPRC